jgi:hypothetical protein
MLITRRDPLKKIVYRTLENTMLDAMYLWGWHKFGWAFRKGPLRKRIDTIFWLQDIDYWSPNVEGRLAPATEIKHSHLLTRKKNCVICNTDKNVLTGEHPILKVDV